MCKICPHLILSKILQIRVGKSFKILDKYLPLYIVEKVTMFCYGEKESWYKDICPSGVLPTLKLNGNFIAESDTIITALEKQFGPLHVRMDEPRVRNYYFLYPHH